MDIANLLLKISGDPGDAKRALKEVAAELQEFGRTDVAAHIGLKGYDDAKKKLDQLEASLTVIGKRDVTAKVKVNVDEAKARLAQLRRELDLSASKGPGALPTKDVLRDIDRLGQALETSFKSRFQKVGEDAKRVFRNLKQDFIGTAAAGAGSVIKAAPGIAASGVGLGLEGAGAAVKGVASLGAAAASALGPMGAILGLLLAFGPALLALVASLAGAAAGFSVLAVSFVGVLAPAALLLLGVVKELTAAYQGVVEKQEAAHQSAAAIAQAQQGVRASTLGVAESQRALKITTEEAYQAWRTQLNAVREDLLGVESAQLGIQSSQLQYKTALQSLKEFRNEIGLGAGKFDDLFKKFQNVDFDPKNILKSIKDAGGGELGRKRNLELQGLILAIKQAKLGEAQAQQGLHNSNEKLQKDRRVEAKYLKEGIRAYPAYIAALRSARTAEEGLVTSQRALNNAQFEATKPISNLSKEQLKLGTLLRAFVLDLKKLFGPATKEIFKGLEDALKSVITLVKNSGLSAAFVGLGRAIGDVFRTLGKTLSSPEMTKNLTALVHGSGELVKVLGSQILVSFIRLFTNLALAAMPAMLKIMRSIGSEFKKLASGSSNIAALRQKIHHIIEEFEKWVKLIGALGALISAFFRDTARQGDGVAASITRVLEKWTKFLNTKAGQQQITTFFKESITFGKELIEVIKSLLEVTKTLIGIAKPLAEAVGGASEFVGEQLGKKAYEPSLHEEEKTEKAHNDETAMFKKNIVSIAKQLKTNRGSNGQPLNPAARKNLEQIKAREEKELGPRLIKRSIGGLIGATWGGGDRIPLLGESGEYMLRKEVVNTVGRSALDRFNATGRIRAGAATDHGTHINVERVILPTTPGHDTMDPRVAAVKFARELSGRGVGSA